MGTGSNFYKNPAFLYDNQSKLSSAIDNLRAYNLATGNVSGKDSNAHENKQESGANLARKRRRNNNFSDNNSLPNDRILFETETLDHEQYKAKLRKETGAFRVFEDSNPNAASTVGFDPYEKNSGERTFQLQKDVLWAKICLVDPESLQLCCTIRYIASWYRVDPLVEIGGQQS